MVKLLVCCFVVIVCALLSVCVDDLVRISKVSDVEEKLGAISRNLLFGCGPE